jgi:5'-nucleotidase
VTHRALITNDDGIDAPGLRALAAAALAAGLDVRVYAPHREASGAGAGLNPGADASPGQIEVSRRHLAGLDDVDAYSVTGTPGLIALAAMTGQFGPIPDIVLSGVNDGANLGASTLHSGTAGAALVAGARGARAMAVSLVRDPAAAVRQWDTAAQVAEVMIPVLLGTDRGTMLNVNVPNVVAGELRGIRRATLASGGIEETVARFVGALNGWPERGGPVPAAGPADAADSDVAVAHQGYASVTPLRLADTGIPLALPNPNLKPSGRPGERQA